jgi:hypothetical protein
MQAAASALLLACAHSAVAQQQPQQTEINKFLVEILNPESGYLDKAQYDRFWAMFPAELRTPQGRQTASSAIRAMMLYSVDYQRAVYESALSSAKARRVIRNPRIDELERRIQEPSQLTPGMESPDQFANTSGFLDAAASGNSIIAPGGPIFVTQELIEKVLSDLQIMKVRLDRLTAAEFHVDKIEYTYAQLGIKILLPEPLSVNVQGASLLAMMTESRSIQGVHNFGPNMTLMIGSTNVSVIETPNSESIRRVLVAAVDRTSRSMGVQDGKTVFSDWRGKNSADFSGTIVRGGKPIAASVKIVFDERKNALLQFLVTDDTIADAESVMNGVLQSTRLIQ